MGGSFAPSLLVVKNEGAGFCRGVSTHRLPAAVPCFSAPVGIPSGHAQLKLNLVWCGDVMRDQGGGGIDLLPYSRGFCGVGWGGWESRTARMYGSIAKVQSGDKKANTHQFTSLGFFWKNNRFNHKEGVQWIFLASQRSNKLGFVLLSTFISSRIKKCCNSRVAWLIERRNRYSPSGETRKICTHAHPSSSTLLTSLSAQMNGGNVSESVERRWALRPVTDSLLCAAHIKAPQKPDWLLVNSAAWPEGPLPALNST